MDRQWSINGRLLFSIGILSSSIIAFQLALMQVLSIVQWYHFAYMVISMALLGFGAAGTVLSLFRQRLFRNISFLIPALMISCGIAMALVTDISQLSLVRFDSYLLFADYSHIGRLVISYLLFFIPFFSGALAVGLTFDHFVSAIGKIYFANLSGSAAGGMLMLVLIWFMFPGKLPAIISYLPVIAGILMIHGSQNITKAALILFAIFALFICTWKVIFPSPLQLSEYKDLSKTLLLPKAEIILEKTSPYGPIQVVTSPAIRYAPGLSLVADLQLPAYPAVFVNGDWSGVVTGYNERDTTFTLQHTTLNLPYVMSERKDVLVLHAGTCIGVSHALSHHAKRIVAVEANAVLMDALQSDLATENDSIFNRPAVLVRKTEPRNFLFSETAQYDLICLPLVGSFGGSAGLGALHEQFLLTKESFIKMWPRLKNGGAISVTVWMDYPARNPLKLAATLTEVLEQLNVEPKQHIAAIRSWGNISFVITKTPMTQEEIQNIRSFCDRWQFDPALLPELRPGERMRFHQLQDNSFFKNLDKLFSDEKMRLYADYDFNIKPATDNSPYFSQFIRWKSMPRLAEFFGNHSIPFFEIGYLLVVITLIQLAVVSFALIMLPLYSPIANKPAWKRKNKAGVLLYFGGIGMGYMFVEIVFIQHLILYFGQPVYAAAGSITVLLFFSGFGSLWSGKGRFANRINRKYLLIVFGAIVVLLFLYSFTLMPVLQQTVQESMLVKMMIVLLMIAPLAFCMGIPFPAGLSQLSINQSDEIPWAWGLNGCASVISTALATIIAVEAGFSMVLLLAAVAYCFPLLMASLWK